MTQNQLSYLGLEETRRSNLVRERQTDDVNRETNRSNLVRERQTDEANAETKRNNVVHANLIGQQNAETNRHNLATEKQSKYDTDKRTAAQIKAAQIGAKATKTSASISAGATKYASNASAAASKYAAETSAAASKYAADSNKAASKYATQTNRDIADLNRSFNVWKTSVDKDQKEAERVNQRAIKEIDRLMNNDRIASQEKQQLRSIKTQLEIAQANNDTSMWKTAIESLTKLATNNPLTNFAKIFK